MNKTHFAALTLTVLIALAGGGVLVHQGTTVTGQDETGVTSPPRTVVMAEPPPCPYPHPAAICSPIPPAPWGSVPEGAPTDPLAAEYSRAWSEIEVTER
ncbi:Uncharacterised protein [Mycobacteroides abscessus subsp. abscessus]|uniref:hypothetical protein n=1 Tax=Mycobacteroides abscessus TaxID=36809 RepID=UPI00092A4270|nr:hypothetical protein [Mycobacteroides abscessus]MDM2173428.1 hypothetical protein [Mycobacteroides abscessus]MDM2176301.1 hypothetical protein [Mycobacteroides abscessus]MDM2204866.1 hypothetical protein [Mycobacteroides abscessus]MDM2213854.1 hypothetical protein [Mycobacteroides abscessus]MDM2215785.1 hypothetical protein [Mycobacteroides abscessus]